MSARPPTRPSLLLRIALALLDYLTPPLRPIVTEVVIEGTRWEGRLLTRRHAVLATRDLDRLAAITQPRPGEDSLGQVVHSTRYMGRVLALLGLPRAAIRAWRTLPFGERAATWATAVRRTARRLRDEAALSRSKAAQSHLN